jgi:hypothetical protein
MNVNTNLALCACGTHTASACKFAGCCKQPPVWDQPQKAEAVATPELDPNRLDPVVEANRALLLKRSQLGIQKYGGTLDEKRYSERDILQHALEEALDLANYLMARIQTIDRAVGKD